MNKENAIKTLRNLADTLEKEGVKLREGSYVDIHCGIEEGFKMDGWNSFAPNGEKDINISFSYYDPDSDKSYKAHINT